MAHSNTRSSKLSDEEQATNQPVNFLGTHFFTNSNADQTNQSACHLVVNPISDRPLVQKAEGHVLPSRPTEKQLIFDSRPSTICYRTFENESSPFSSPLKRSSTFAGVFNSLFKQTDYNHLLGPKSHLKTSDKPNRVGYSKSNYDFESRFVSSEPSSNEHRQLITTQSSANILPNLIDLQSIKQSLLSMAVVLTKHSSSNTGRVVEPTQSNSQRSLLGEKSLPDLQSIPNTLSSSPSTLTEPSSSFYTNNEASTVVIQDDLPSLNANFCTLCLQYIEANEFVTLENCRCGFCRPCLVQYCTIIIRDHSIVSSQITCPSYDCAHSNNYLNTQQIEQLVDRSTFRLYEKIKLDSEVHLDPNRVWCPRANCETVCTISSNEISKNEKSFGSSNLETVSVRVANSDKTDRRVPVTCKNCNLTFCLHCRRVYHGKMPCQSPSEDESLSLLLSRTRTPNSLNEYIKKCPQCGIFIERDRGCAQMMCQKCKHVFCWFCLSSLEEDLLLRHYDSGLCKDKLGHSKGTLLWLRFQVIAVFIGFAFFLILLSPFLLISAPILLIAHYFCNLSFSNKVWTKDDLFDTNDQTQTNRTGRQSNRPNDHLTLNQSNQAQSSQRINFIDSNDSNINSTTNTHQQLIQSYIENNGVHKLINLDQTLFIEHNVQESSLFDDQPIKLSGYDREVIETKRNTFSSWFKWKKSERLDPPPRLSSMLDVEKHRKFMEELMADKLSLNNELNSVDIDKHYMVISRSDANVHKTTRNWLTFWKRNN